MKHKHRILALSALLAVGATALLGSCSGGDVTAETSAVTDPTETAAVTETAAPQLDRLEELGERDLGGMIYTVLDCNSAAYSNIPGDTQTGEIINDTLIERDTAIEERYNVQIDYELESSGSTSKFRSSVLSGEKPCDLIFTVGAKLSTLALEGVLANMLDVEHISLDRPGPEAETAPINTGAARALRAAPVGESLRVTADGGRGAGPPGRVGCLG